MKRVVKSIDPLQCGKVLGVLYAAISLIFIPLILLFSLFSLLLAPAEGGGSIAAVITVFIGLCVLAPVFYGVMGFFTGLIGAWCYNFIARFVGGISVEVE